jgi:alkanesulfonate monooxygenase SsuD/methylene tetrahydromethanopterin reductase-like flavin-dependent oxidoreductase (luciferase family)
MSTQYHYIVMKEILMQYGLAITNAIDARALVALAQEAEAAGWDGIFYWDSPDSSDAWVALTAAAMSTKRIKLGTMVTPLPQQLPWKVAGEAATLDQLSNGRVILPVGLGVTDFERTGIPKDYKIRAKMLDEGLAIVQNMWHGEPFSYEDGKYYHIEPHISGEKPVQQPRIPIWVVGGEKQTQLRRAARWDGAMIQGTPEEIAARKNAIMQLREITTPLDIITEGSTPGDNPEQAASIVRAYAEAGLTWWNEAVWDTPWSTGGLEGVRMRIKQGPPPRM